MKIIFFTNDKSPFMIELMENVSSKLPKESELIYVAKKDLDDDRTHWKVKKHSELRFERMPVSVKEFLDLENPDILIYVGYHGGNLITIKKWSRNHKKKFFIWAGERILEYNINYGHFKKYNKFFVMFKYLMHKYYTKNVNGLIACGNRASYLYQENTKYKIPIVNVPYVFNMKDMLSREMMTFDGENLTFLISGRLLEYRDPLHAIKLFHKLIPLLPDLKIRLIVSGLGPLYDDVKKLVSNLKIEDKVTYENDFQDWYDIRQIYYRSHILFCMHQYSGWGLTIQEAMAAGQLVIASNAIDAADQLIINGYNGLLVHKSSDKDTLNEIVNLLMNKIKFHYCRVNARETVKTIDLDIISTRLVDFISLN